MNTARFIRKVREFSALKRRSKNSFSEHVLTVAAIAYSKRSQDDPALSDDAALNELWRIVSNEYAPLDAANFPSTFPQFENEILRRVDGLHPPISEGGDRPTA